MNFFIISKPYLQLQILNDFERQIFIEKMPLVEIFRPGDTVNVPKIVIPGQETDESNTLEDERQLKTVPEPHTPLPDYDRDQDGDPNPSDPDDDNDGEADTSDPEPQNPSVTTASNNPPSPSPSGSGTDGSWGDHPDIIDSDDLWSDLEEINDPTLGGSETPAGRIISAHAQESLPRHGFEEPYSEVDDIIDNASRQTPQVDGATVYIQSNSNGTYNIAIVNTQENIIVTAMQNLEPFELRQLGQNYGFDPNP